MSLVSANEISQIHESRKIIKKDTYKKILEQFSKKIKYHAEINQTSAVLVVPAIVVGFPTFDRSLAAIYLERQLKNGGYSTRRLDDVTIYVQWGTKSKKKQKEQSSDGPDFGDLNGLVNLRKVANKYRK